MKINYAPTFIDLFAGCGGFSLGLEQAGFKPLYVNELNKDAMDTYIFNRKHYPLLRSKYFSNDIKTALRKHDFFEDLFSGFKKDYGEDFNKSRIDLLVGGPPCQGFSGIGVRRSYSVEKKQLPANHLFEDMAYFIFKIKPKVFIFENVEGLINSRWTKEGTKGEVFDDIKNTFLNIEGYHVQHKLIYAKDYGVPQNRPRVLIIGISNDIISKPESADPVISGFFPKPIGTYPNIEDVLSDLVDENFSYGGETRIYPSAILSDWQKIIRRKYNSETTYRKGDLLTEHQYSNHSQRVQERFKIMLNNQGRIPEKYKNKKFAQRLLPRKWLEKGPTITCCSLPDDFVHYSQARCLTVREWARLQTFPDWYQFKGKRTTGGLRRAGNPLINNYDRELPKYTQIGNAVPVKLAYEIGLHIKNIVIN